MVIGLKLSKDLNNITLEELVSSLRIHEIELEEDEPQKKGKLVSLKSISERTKTKKNKAYQAEEMEDSADDVSDDDDELSLLSRRVNKLWKNKQSKWL